VILAAGTDSFGYRLLLLLHILSVLIGFGPYFLNGLLPRASARASEEGARVANAAALQISTVSQFAIYGVLIFGGALIGASDKKFKFSQEWVPIAIVLWVVAVGVLHGLILPTQRRLRDAGSDREALTTRLSMSMGILNLIVIVVIVLMIWKPGAPHA
jgi:uncharacterized membrane protein